MSRLKKLLSNREYAAYRGLVESCTEDGGLVFPKMKLADVVQIGRSGLPENEFDYATKAHLDFLIAHNRLPSLAVECDFVDKDSKGLQQAELKDRICADLGVPLVRVDCRLIEERSIAHAMNGIVSEWKSTRTDTYCDSLISYCGCLLHDGDCTPSICSEFREIAAWLFLLNKLTDDLEDENFSPPRVRIETNLMEDGYTFSQTFLVSDELELVIGKGHCRCPEALRPFATRLSQRMALWNASDEIQNTRNKGDLGERCFIDFKQ